MHIILKQCHLVDPVTNRDEANIDIEIKDGKIVAIGKSSGSTDAIVYNLNGKIVAPGFFDMHVHLREPGQEYKETIETGTRAAAAGGFTGVCCMPNTDPPISDPFVVSYIKDRSKNSLVDVEICGTMTKSRKGEELAALGALKEAGVRMVSDDGSAVMNAEVMRRVFEYAKMFDLLCTQHCEEHSMTKGTCMHEGKVSAKLGLPGYPSVAEDLIVARDIMLAEYVGGVRYHAAHLSTGEAVDLVRQAKKKGLPVTCEVTPHHFTLTDEAVETHWGNAKMNPPLREQADIEAIIAGLQDGTIDCIATDHAPHATSEKETDMMSAAYGIIGLESAIGLGLTNLVHKGKLSLSEYIRKCSTNPRSILRLEEIRFEVGATTNLTIIDIDKEWTFTDDSIFSKSSNTPFRQTILKGKAMGVINHSQTAGELFTAAG
jgi:dihydroorotase